MRALLGEVGFSPEDESTAVLTTTTTLQLPVLSAPTATGFPDIFAIELVTLMTECGLTSLGQERMRRSRITRARRDNPGIQD